MVRVVDKRGNIGSVESLPHGVELVEAHVKSAALHFRDSWERKSFHGQNKIVRWYSAH
jgi:hypothetical protein